MEQQAHFQKCKELFDYQHLPDTSGSQSSNLYLNDVHILNTSVSLRQLFSCIGVKFILL